MNPDQVQATVLRRDIEHQASTVLALVERIEGRRNADKDTVQLFSGVVEGLTALRGTLMTHITSTSNKPSGGGLDDEDGSPF